MTQMNVGEGIRKFDAKVSEALLNEMNQLHKQLALHKNEDMSHEDKKHYST